MVSLRDTIFSSYERTGLLNMKNQNQGKSSLTLNIIILISPTCIVSSTLLYAKSTCTNKLLHLSDNFTTSRLKILIKGGCFEKKEKKICSFLSFKHISKLTITQNSENR